MRFLLLGRAQLFIYAILDKESSEVNSLAVSLAWANNCFSLHSIAGDTISDCAVYHIAKDTYSNYTINTRGNDRSRKLHCKENWIYLFPERELHVSVSDLYVPTFGPPVFSCIRIGRPIRGIYKSLMNVGIGTAAAQSFLGIFVSNFRYCVFAVCIENISLIQPSVFHNILLCLAWQSCSGARSRASSWQCSSPSALPPSSWSITGSTPSQKGEIHHLKGVWHEILEFRFFYESVAPRPLSIPLGPLRIFTKFAEIFANLCLLPVSTTRVIKPCLKFSSILWHRRLIFRR